jgi:hypothetical protein
MLNAARKRDCRAMRVAFVVRSLQAGGTVRQLVNLALGLRRRGHSIAVLRLFDGDDLGVGLADAGVDTPQRRFAAVLISLASPARRGGCKRRALRSSTGSTSRRTYSRS